MPYTNRFTEGAALLYQLAPASQTILQTGTLVYVGNYARIAAIISLGVMAGTATFNAKLRQAVSSTGSPKDFTPAKAITQLTQAGGDSGKIVVIECRGEELDVAGGYCYVQVTATPASAAVIFGMQLWGWYADYRPVPTTGIAEIVD